MKYLPLIYLLVVMVLVYNNMPTKEERELSVAFTNYLRERVMLPDCQASDGGIVVSPSTEAFASTTIIRVDGQWYKCTKTAEPFKLK